MKRKEGLGRTAGAVIIIRTTVILPVLPRIHLVLASLTFFSHLLLVHRVGRCVLGGPCNMWRGEDVEYKSTSVANDDDAAVPWSRRVDSLILTRGGETSESFEKKSFPHCRPIQLLSHFLTLCNRQYILRTSLSG